MNEEAVYGTDGTLSVSKEIEFDAGHRVPTHEGKCRSPHGHRYRVRVTCTGEVEHEADDPEAGMLCDFGFIKDLLTVHVHDVFDHGMIVWEQDAPLLRAMGNVGGLLDPDEPAWKVIVFPLIPTAENIARWVAFKLDNLIAARNTSLALSRVDVWETPTSVASWERVA